MTGDCQEMMIEGPLSSIRASYGDRLGLSGISYFRGLTKKTYGTVGEEYTEWVITEDEPLVGLYGNYNENGVERLGLITLDVQCQADILETVEEQSVVIPDPVEEVISEEQEELVVNEPMAQDEIREEEETQETIIEQDSVD